MASKFKPPSTPDRSAESADTIANGGLARTLRGTPGYPIPLDEGRGVLLLQTIGSLLAVSPESLIAACRSDPSVPKSTVETEPSSAGAEELAELIRAYSRIACPRERVRLLSGVIAAAAEQNDG